MSILLKREEHWAEMKKIETHIDLLISYLNYIDHPMKQSPDPELIDQLHYVLENNELIDWLGKLGVLSRYAFLSDLFKPLTGTKYHKYGFLASHGVVPTKAALIAWKRHESDWTNYKKNGSQGDPPPLHEWYPNTNLLTVKQKCDQRDIFKKMVEEIEKGGAE